MRLVSDGKAPCITQPTEGATYDPMLNKKELCKINWDQPAENLHNFIRGLDSSPGAWMMMDGQEVSTGEGTELMVRNSLRVMLTAIKNAVCVQ